MQVSVQVLDVAHGRPAAAVEIRLERSDGRQWSLVAAAKTDDSGHIDRWDGPEPGTGSFCLVVDARRYFATLGLSSAQTDVMVSFAVTDASVEHHIPVLLAPFGYSIYTGATS